MTASADTTRAPSSIPATGPDVTRLLHIDKRDLAGLRWVKGRCLFWITCIRRYRKYEARRGSTYSETESQLIEALTGLEREAGRLLDLITQEESDHERERITSPADRP